MKKYTYMLLSLFVLLFAACDPTTEELGSPSKSITADELTSSFSLTAESEGNNNITVNITKANYIKVYDASNDALLAQGLTSTLSFQVAPPARDVDVYITVMNADGTITKSANKTVSVTNFTKLPEVYNELFGKTADGYGTTTWTWDDTVSGNYWGNGSWGSDLQGGWWGAPTSTDIDEQATGKGLTTAGDGKGAWFSLSLSGVKTSRGETGAVTVSTKVASLVSGTTPSSGWGLGTMTFSGTFPPMGILPNDGNAPCYTYTIVKADGEHLVLCAQSGSGYEGWFLCFKKIENK